MEDKTYEYLKSIINMNSENPGFLRVEEKMFLTDFISNMIIHANIS